MLFCSTGAGHMQCKECGLKAEAAEGLLYLLSNSPVIRHMAADWCTATMSTLACQLAEHTASIYTVIVVTLPKEVPEPG